MMIVAQAPCRIDFAGSVTDVQPFCDHIEGVVVNAAVNRYVRCTYLPEPADGFVVLDQINNDMLQVAGVEEMPAHGLPGRLKACLQTFPALSGGTFLLQSDLRHGSGMASSSALLTCLVAAITAALHQTLSPAATAEIAYQIERHSLGLLCGRQDAYASVQGGLSQFTFSQDRVTRRPISLPPALAGNFLSGLYVAYTTVQRSSDHLMRKMIEMLAAQDPLLLDVMTAHSDLARQAGLALADGHLRRFGQLLNESQANQERLPIPVSPPQARMLLQSARAAGAWGARLGGVGGGGYATLLLPLPQRQSIARQLRAQGWALEPIAVDWMGLRVHVAPCTNHDAKTTHG